MIFVGSTSSMRMRNKPPIWVMALLKRVGKRARRKRAGRRARRKTKLLTNAGTPPRASRMRWSGAWRRGLWMGVIFFQAGAWMKSHHIASGGERGRSAGALVFIRRAIPQRQTGVKKI